MSQERNEFDVVFVGEFHNGKSALIEKFLNPSMNIETGKNLRHFSRNTVKNANATTSDGKQISLKLHEVSGSRGRMSNYHNMITATKNAHLIVFCYSSQNEYALNSLNRVLDIIFSKRKSIDIPVMMVETFSDLPSSPNSLGDIKASEKNYKLVRASSLTGKGVNEVFQTIADTLFEKVSPVEDVEMTEAQVAPATKLEPKTKSTVQKMVSKIMGPFVSADSIASSA